ncbi:IPT/TIG domain-containing protein [Terriglobus tenax]|uniref:IPT/TIG domain-containing protein n=1 Tax=Terriglobus tenax TaxID=1111115 RepID=UPI0021DF87B3|nr:IPT/TIG domain-containing protein [Terriglobus tenax]
MRANSRWIGLLLLFPALLQAATPRWTAGSKFGARVGQPVVWQGPSLAYFVDRGDLSPSVPHDQAVQMVDSVMQTWNIPYASLTLSNGGSLAEDVSGSNVSMASTGINFPTDVTSSNYAAKPVAVIFDADGSITDLLLGSGSSDPLYCRQNAVTESVDLFLLQTGYIGHAILVLNGRCTGTPEQLLEMKYQLLRKTGRVLGLGWSQCNDNVFTGTPTPTYQQAMHWPIMHPIDILCGPYAYQCLPSPFTLRDDDISGMVSLYPSTGGNGKLSSQINGAGMYSTLKFPSGQGMQGVNIVVQLQPQFWNVTFPWETASAVTGTGFVVSSATPITPAPTGINSQVGLARSDLPGYWQIGRVPMVTATWETMLITGQPVNPLYVGQYSVGSYTSSQVLPSGTISLQTNIVRPAYYGPAPLVATNAAATCNTGSDGTESSPAAVASTGWWSSQMCAWNHTAWLTFTAGANRTFTLEVTALNESGAATTQKLLPTIGLWKKTDSYGTLPTVAATTQAFNSTATGVSLLRGSTSSAQAFRIALADQRGDGRPDYFYKARLLLIDSIWPTQLPAGGGTLTLTGRGFRPGNSVLIGNTVATVLSTTSTQMVVTAPPLGRVSNAASWTGGVMVLDMATQASSTLGNALSYTGGTATGISDELILVSGGSQSVSSSGSFSKLVLQVTDGAGNNLPGATVQVHQTLTGYAPVCTTTGRCAVPPVYGTVNASMITDSAGRVEVTPMEISGAEVTQIVATTGRAGYISTRLEKTP